MTHGEYRSHIARELRVLRHKPTAELDALAVTTRQQREHYYMTHGEYRRYIARDLRALRHKATRHLELLERNTRQHLVAAGRNIQMYTMCCARLEAISAILGYRK